MTYVVGKCLFALCSHYHSIKKGLHFPVPTSDAVEDEAQDYLIPAEDFIQAVKHHNPHCITFTTRTTTLKTLVNKGKLPTAPIPAESAMGDGREESQAVFMREVQAGRLQARRLQARQGVMDDRDVGESGETPVINDGESGDEGGHGSQGPERDNHGHHQRVEPPRNCNVVNVMECVDTITTMHVDRGYVEGASPSEVWLTEECNMAPIKESLYNLRLAINNPTTFHLDSVKANVEQLLGEHKSATSQVIR
jgi:hypothetical protein